MGSVLAVILLAVLAVAAWLAARRFLDLWRDRRERDRLLALQPNNPAVFDPGMVADLPDAARRYFENAIRPGTPLLNVAEIVMSGRFGMGTKAAHRYFEMEARQVLAAPAGFIWQMRARGGRVRLSGSDSGQWTRFWLAGLVPVARMNGGADHRRAAWGRCIAEAVFWTPAALLPGPGVVWSEVDGQTAEVTVSRDGLSQSVRVSVDAQGRAVRVVFPRWSNANPAKVWQEQPFGGTLSQHREFGGFRLATRVEAGNFFGTEEYFPFFDVTVTDLSFPPAA